MTDEGRGLDAARYDRFRPDLGKVRGLDLSWDAGPVQWATNFGLSYLYAVGNTGHRYLAACVIQGLAPEEYPIALVDEEGPTVDIFASSITTWLPSYILYTAEDWLGTSLGANARGQRVEWLEEEVAGFLADQEALRDALRGFTSPAVEAALATITATLRDRETLTVSGWRPADLYEMVEPAGYVSAYRRLMASPATTPADWRQLIRSRPFYNRPLFQFFSEPAWDRSAPDADERRTFFARSAFTVRKDLDLPAGLPTELAHEVLRRRTAHDSDGIYDRDLLETAARLIGERHEEPAGPFAPMIRLLAEGDALLGEPFFEAGQRCESAGADRQALICYENALDWYCQETEAWYWDALAGVRRVAARLGDENYLYYLDNGLQDILEGAPPEE